MLEQQPVNQNDVVEVLGEEHLFFSIFSNLIKNAIEASPEGKEITVTFSARLMARTLGGDIAFTSSETDGTTLIVTFGHSTIREKEQKPDEEIHIDCNM